ncbi:MerR family transcriptional regulator [Streptomyces sp. NPDC006622]|uniref:MerR family transcriptional regulator n=1 Tax=Streptomyces sp. NPDC006622 TaxID=3155459 RepID=UPI0033B9C7ED
MNDDGTGLFPIGELARATGLSVRTIRYWSDEGVLAPVARSAGGYRLYDAESAARLELIRTLRELGLGLDAVRRVLAGETTVGLLGDADRAAVLDRLTAAADVRVARYRELSAVLNGLGPVPGYEQEFAWVVAALRAHPDR